MSINVTYPKLAKWYNSERREIIPSYNYFTQNTIANPSLIVFHETSTNLFHFNPSGTDVDNPKTVTLFTLANDVKVKCEYYLQDTTDDYIRIHTKIGLYDKNGNRIVMEPVVNPVDGITLDCAISGGASVSDCKVYYTPPSYDWDTTETDYPKASQYNYMGSIYTDKTNASPYDAPAIIGVTEEYGRNNLLVYYNYTNISGVNSQSEYDLIQRKIIDGGDGTPITPILPSEDPSQPGGGDDANPDYNPFSDPIGYPDLPTGGNALDTGFVTVYAPTSAQLQAFAGELWSNDFITTIHKTNNDPMEGIISLHSVPFQIVVGSSVNAKVGNYQSEVSMLKVTAQYYTLNCGNISLPEHWASALDYAPYTNVEIYLPFVGVRPFQVDDIMNKVIEVKYNIDILTGASICMVKCGDSVLYTFPCTISQQIPYTMSNRVELYRAIVNAVSSIASSASGGPSGGAGAISAAAGVALSKHSSITRGGQLDGNIGVLGDFTPYLIIHRPIQSLASDFASKKGYPSNITSSLSSLSGYTVVDKIHLTNIDCTDTERDEIHALLKDGVIL